MRVLIIRFSSLGDCVLLSPLPGALHAAGATEVAVLTSDTYAPLFAATEGVDRVFAINRRKPHSLGDACERLKRENYTILDAHNNWRSRRVCRLLGAPAARLRKFYRERLMLIVLKRVADLPTMLDQYGALGAVLGAAPSLSPGGIVIPERAGQRADALLGPDARRAIAIAPGGRWPGKRWRVEGFIAAARHAAAHLGCRIVLLGDTADVAITASVAQAVNAPDLVDLAGELDVLEAAAVLKRCTALVVNDSGLMHLSEAVGTPVVSVFGPTVRAFGYYPALPDSSTVEMALACRPCSRNGAVPCPRFDHRCMSGIPDSAVVGALADMLDGGTGRRHILPA